MIKSNFFFILDLLSSFIFLANRFIKLNYFFVRFLNSIHSRKSITSNKQQVTMSAKITSNTTNLMAFGYWMLNKLPIDKETIDRALEVIRVTSNDPVSINEFYNEFEEHKKDHINFIKTLMQPTKEKKTKNSKKVVSKEETAVDELVNIANMEVTKRKNKKAVKAAEVPVATSTEEAVAQEAAEEAPKPKKRVYKKKAVAAAPEPEVAPAPEVAAAAEVAPVVDEVKEEPKEPQKKKRQYKKRQVTVENIENSDSKSESDTESEQESVESEVVTTTEEPEVKEADMEEEEEEFEEIITVECIHKDKLVLKDEQGNIYDRETHELLYNMYDEDFE